MANEKANLKDTVKADQVLPCEPIVVQATVKKRRPKFKPGSNLAETVNKISADVDDNSTDETVDFTILLKIGLNE